MQHPDKVEIFHGSLIQHGPHNNRIYLMRLNHDEVDRLIPALESLALTRGYDKIFAKIPENAWPSFKRADYVKEAVVPRFYRGEINGFFLGKFFSAKRQLAAVDPTLERLVSPTSGVPAEYLAGEVPAEAVSRCTSADAEEMSYIYQRVFATYPFPLFNPGYIRAMMEEGLLYFCIRKDGRIAALASTEIDQQNNNAEMTDFATLSEWRGSRFAALLLDHMGQAVSKRGVKTAYTIARAESHGMNAVFKRCGYTYAGLLKNNTQISGGIQSMTVWYRHL